MGELLLRKVQRSRVAVVPTSVSIPAPPLLLPPPPLARVRPRSVRLMPAPVRYKMRLELPPPLMVMPAGREEASMMRLVVMVMALPLEPVVMEMVWPESEGSKLMIAPPAAPLIAARRLPVPESAVLVTMTGGLGVTSMSWLLVPERADQVLPSADVARTFGRVPAPVALRSSLLRQSTSPLTLPTVTQYCVPAARTGCVVEAMTNVVSLIERMLLTVPRSSTRTAGTLPAPDHSFTRAELSVEPSPVSTREMLPKAIAVGPVMNACAADWDADVRGRCPVETLVRLEMMSVACATTGRRSGRRSRARVFIKQAEVRRTVRHGPSDVVSSLLLA